MKPQFIESFKQGALVRWKTELLSRLLPEYYQAVVEMKRLHDQETCTDGDLAMWHKIQVLRTKLAKDSFDEQSMFTSFRRAAAANDYDALSKLQLQMAAAIHELKILYHDYKQNIID